MDNNYSNGSLNSEPNINQSSTNPNPSINPAYPETTPANNFQSAVPIDSSVPSPSGNTYPANSPISQAYQNPSPSPLPQNAPADNSAVLGSTPSSNTQDQSDPNTPDVSGLMGQAVISPPASDAVMPGQPAQSPPVYSIPPSGPIGAQFNDGGNSTEYKSNPFLNTAEGIVQVLKNNPASSMLSTLLFIIPAIAYFFLIFGHKSVIVLLLLGIIFAAWELLEYGVLSVIAAESLENRTISLSAAVKRSSKKIPNTFLLALCQGLIIFAGFILLVIPGIILLARLSLSSIVMFDENLGPIESIKRSFKLTKGHTIEILASVLATYTLISGSLLIPVIAIAPIVGRYGEIKQISSGATKQKTHWLNWLMLVLVVLGFFAFAGFIILAVIHHPNVHGSSHIQYNFGGHSSNLNVPTNNFSGASSSFSATP